MFDDEELDIGLRVTLKDAFSAAATKIEGAWKGLQARLRGNAQGPTLLQRGLDGVKGAAERLREAFAARRQPWGDDAPPLSDIPELVDTLSSIMIRSYIR